MAKKNHAIFLRAIEVGESSLKIVQQSRAHNPRFKNDLELASASLFGSYLALDLHCGMIAAYSTWDEHRRGYLWRTVVLTLYEGLEQYIKYVMPALARFLKALPSPDLSREQRLCAKRFSLLRSKCWVYLHAIRNSCIAHRDLDPAQFARVRESVEETRLTNYLAEFIESQGEAERIIAAAFQRALASRGGI